MLSMDDYVAILYVVEQRCMKKYDRLYEQQLGSSCNMLQKNDQNGNYYFIVAVRPTG